MDTHGRLNIETFVEPSFQENGFLLWCTGAPDCWLVDPGFPPQQTQQFAAAVEQRGLTPRAILITHGHVDHIAGVGALRSLIGDVPIVCPRGEEQLLTSAEENLSTNLGLDITVPPAEQTVAHGDALALGDLEWRVLDVSGHSPAGVTYHCPEAAVAIVGDAVFAEGIGRYDFPHSSHRRLIKNIRQNLLTLPGETRIYPGHGPSATLEQMLEFNLTLRAELEQC